MVDMELERRKYDESLQVESGRVDMSNSARLGRLESRLALLERGLSGCLCRLSEHEHILQNGLDETLGSDVVSEAKVASAEAEEVVSDDRSAGFRPRRGRPPGSKNRSSKPEASEVADG
jgi:hypothetical protein